MQVTVSFDIAIQRCDSWDRSSAYRRTRQRSYHCICPNFTSTKVIFQVFNPSLDHLFGSYFCVLMKKEYQSRIHFDPQGVANLWVVLWSRSCSLENLGKRLPFRFVGSLLELSWPPGGLRRAQVKPFFGPVRYHFGWFMLCTLHTQIDIQWHIMQYTQYDIIII